MNEELKKESLKITANLSNTVIPCLTITPTLTLNDKEWHKLVYILLSMRTQIEDQLGVPLIITLNDILDQKSCDETMEQIKTINKDTIHVQ